MRRPVVLGLLLAAISFAAGYVIRGVPRSEADRQILYYVDPMHPSYRSDKPGIAPDCGMKLVPVYVGDSLASQLQLPPNAVYVTAAMQKLTGVAVTTVEKNSGARSLYASGVVQPDESRLYRLTAAIDGWVRSLGDNPSGTAVKKGEVLGTFFSPEFRDIERAYIGALQLNQEPGEASELNLRIIEDRLRAFGMSDQQIEEIRKTREYVSDIKIVSPADGVVLSRSINLQQRFQAQAEFYRIADLNRIWIIASVSGEPAMTLPPGTSATLTVGGTGQAFHAVVSKATPLFDAATHTLNVRLEADNPGLQLRPDMLVDVEFSIAASPGISVPAEAVIDSGQRKLVYIETGTDLFEPRAVETGDAAAGRVTVVHGLQPGDRVVASGTFLIDSESRMNSATGQHD